MTKSVAELQTPMGRPIGADQFTEFWLLKSLSRASPPPP